MSKLYRARNEHGFTLVELLVVIIIIGILAAIAIPVFLNQRQRANDAELQSNVKSLVNSLEAALVSYPNAEYFSLAKGGEGQVILRVGNSSSDYLSETVAMGSGSRIALVNAGSPGTYRIHAYRDTGKQYDSLGSTLTYDSLNGGFNGSPSAVTVARQNLVADGSFESGLSGWSPYFSAPSTRSSDAKTGSYSLEYTVNDPGRAQGGFYMIHRDWKPGDTVTASAWVKAPSGVRYSLGFRSHTGGHGAGYANTTQVGNGDWQQISATYTLPEVVDSTWYAPQFTTQSPLPPVGTKLLIDDVLVELTDTAGEYINGSVTGDIPSHAWVTVT